MGEEPPTHVAAPIGAVFLSYASEDAVAAERICNGLRAAGIDVWFDQSELRGGDAWDALIRKRIKTCALFMAVISVNAHARVEGYFRLEWKLAIDRSHLMAPDRSFLLPVVIDATPQTDERMPERFRELHWTYAAGGELPAAFVRHVRQLLSPQPAPAPIDPRPVHGSNERHDGSGDPARIDQPARFSPPPMARLPARVEQLIGREQDLAALADLMRRQRAVTVLGPGGIGKTQCVLEMARRLADDFPDGVWFFDLVPLKQGADWLRALAAALALAASDKPDLLAEIVPLLRGRRMLLVLDNCDRLAAELGALVLAVLRATDALKVVSTSQASLNFLGEYIMRLPPLALPDGGAIDEHGAQQIAAAPAIEMFLMRVAAVQPGFRLSEANAATIVEICRRLDGVPLALELAAARFALLSADQVLSLLEQRFRFLSSAAAGRDTRHQNLLALLDWSFGLLSHEEQQLLRWLSVFVQGWSMDAAIDLAAALGHDPAAAMDLLTGLVNRSLVSVSPGAVPRYRLLETVREYAFERLREADEEHRARRAHVDFVVRMCETTQLDMLGGRMRERVEQMFREHGNISAAVEFAAGTGGERTAALRIVGGLMLYMKARGTFDDADRWCRRALEGADTIESAERGRALLCQGVILVHRVAADAGAEKALLEAARLAKLHDDQWTEAYAHGYHSLWLSNWRRPAEAAKEAATLESIVERLRDATLRGLAGLARGWIHMARGEYGAAVEVLRSVRHLGNDLHQRHFIDAYISLALFGLGEDAAPAAQWAESLREAAEVGNLRGMAASIEGCGCIAAKRGSWSDAARYLSVAEKIRQRTGMPLFNFWAPHHDAAEKTLRARLGPAEFESCVSAGRRMREEDAVNEVRLRLQHFSTFGKK